MGGASGWYIGGRWLFLGHLHCHLIGGQDVLWREERTGGGGVITRSVEAPEDSTGRSQYLGWSFKGGVHRDLRKVPVIDVFVAVPHTADQIGLWADSRTPPAHKDKYLTSQSHEPSCDSRWR